MKVLAESTPERARMCDYIVGIQAYGFNEIEYPYKIR